MHFPYLYQLETDILCIKWLPALLDRRDFLEITALNLSLFVALAWLYRMRQVPHQLVAIILQSFS